MDLLQGFDKEHLYIQFYGPYLGRLMGWTRSASYKGDMHERMSNRTLYIVEMFLLRLLAIVAGILYTFLVVLYMFGIPLGIWFTLDTVFREGSVASQVFSLLLLVRFLGLVVFGIWDGTKDESRAQRELYFKMLLQMIPEKWR